MWLMLQWRLEREWGVNPEVVRKSVPAKAAVVSGSPKLAACQAGYLSAGRGRCGLSWASKEMQRAL